MDFGITWNATEIIKVFLIVFFSFFISYDVLKQDPVLFAIIRVLTPSWKKLNSY